MACLVITPFSFNLWKRLCNFAPLLFVGQSYIWLKLHEHRTCAHGFSGFQLMLNIVSFHTNKHVNAPPQCDPAGVVGGRLIEYSEAMSRECSTVLSAVECSAAVLRVECWEYSEHSVEVHCRSRSPPAAFKSSFSPLLPPYDVSHLPRCAATLSSSFSSSSFLSSSSARGQLLPNLFHQYCNTFVLFYSLCSSKIFFHLSVFIFLAVSEALYINALWKIMKYHLHMVQLWYVMLHIPTMHLCT